MAATPVSDGAESAINGSSSTAAKAREMLSTVVRDPTWQIAVRNGALSALIRITGTSDDGPQLLAALLRELDEGSILGDKGGELRGQLRSFLYPQHLSANEIWDYADRVLEEAAPSPVLRGPGWKFWTKHLVDGSSPKDIRILLDTLAPRANRLNPLLAQNGVESVILRLLARGLELFGDKEPIAKLHEWFELVENDHAHTELVPAHCKAVRLRSRHKQDQKRIHGWLRCHPEIQLGLILEGVKQHARRKIILVRPIGMKFLGKTAPPNFRKWCMETAIRLADESIAASRHLASWATTEEDEDRWGRPLSDEWVATAIQSAPSLQKWNSERLAGRAWLQGEKARLRKSSSFTRLRERQQAYIDSIQEHLPTIQEGEGPPGILHELGRVYLSGLEAGGADQAHEDLRWHLRPDFALVAAVTEGFRRLSRRRDLPTLKEITTLHRQGRMSPFAAPFLAGLCEEEAAGSDPIQHLDKEGLSRALGFYLLSGLPTRRHPDPRLLSFTEDCRPRWFRLALKNHPQAVANAFVAVHRVRVAVKEAPRPTRLGLGKSGIQRRRPPRASRYGKGLPESLHRAPGRVAPPRSACRLAVHGPGLARTTRTAEDRSQGHGQCPANALACRGPLCGTKQKSSELTESRCGRQRGQTATPGAVPRPGWLPPTPSGLASGRSGGSDKGHRRSAAASLGG